MQFNLRSCFVFILVFNLKNLEAQSVIKEFHKTDLSDSIYGRIFPFPNGDLLLMEHYYPGRRVQLSRISKDLSTIIWSKIVNVNTTECDIDPKPIDQPNRLNKIPHQISIDSLEHIWLHFYSDLATPGFVNHIMLLSPNGDFLWQRGFYSEKRTFYHHGNSFIDRPNGVDFYIQSYDNRYNDQDSIILISVDYNGNAILKSIYSHANYDDYDLYENNHIMLSPNENIILENHFFGLYRNTSMFGLNFLNDNSHRNFRIDTSKIDIYLALGGISEWLSNEEFILITTFAQSPDSYYPVNGSILIARVNINGKVVWSKTTDMSEPYWDFSLWYYGSRFASHIEDDKLFVPISGINGTGSGFLTLDLETGVLLEADFWYNDGMDSRSSQMFKFEDKVYIHNEDIHIARREPRTYPPFIMMDNLNNPSSCIKIPSCEFEVNDFPLEFILEESPLTIIQKDSVLESRCSLQVEIIPAELEWREICPEIIQQPDAFFTFNSDTLCQKELIPVIVQHNHQAFKYTWKLNGQEITPDTARNDTFYFSFDLEGEAELHLTTSRLGCISEYSDSIFIKLGAEVHVPSDTAKCIGESILIDLPSEDGFVIQWENGSIPLEVDTPGVYVFTSFNTTTGCMFTSSVNVSDKEAPTVQIDSFYSFCSNDLGRRILPKVIGLDTKMEWIYPVQPGRFLLYPATSDTYLLKVEREGCIDTISVKVEVLPCTDTDTEICNVFIPDAFSPNDDGINDHLEIFLGCKSGILSFRLEIFDRWGNMVFQSNEFNTQWDGNFEGRIAPTGGYTYKLKMTLESENEFEEVFKEGFVGLVR